MTSAQVTKFLANSVSSAPLISQNAPSTKWILYKKAQEELGLDRLIYGYTYIAEKGNDYQNQLEWTTISPLLVTEIEWLDTIIKTIEIKNGRYR